MNQAFWYPKVNAFLNLGAQAEYMKFTNKAPYYLGGLQVDIPIFGGRRNEYKTQMARLDRQTATYNKELMEGQVELGVNIAMNNCTSAMLTYDASLKQLEAVAAYQRLIEKGYKEGVNTFIETVDAREQLVKVQLLVNINQFKVMLAYTDLEKETATYNINK
jgi:outer membrane protein TolC